MAATVLSGSAFRTGTGPDQILTIALGFFGAKALLSATELGLFTELSAGPLTLEEITSRLGLHPRGARDFLDSLVAMGLLLRENSMYSNAAVSDQYLVRTRTGYIGGLLEMANFRLYDAWGKLTEALKTGKPQSGLKDGEDLFGTLYSDPSRLKQFLSAMTGLSLLSGRAIAQKFPWKQYNCFVDIGCAQGGVPVELALAHSHLRGAGFDLPQVGPIFQDYVHSYGLDKRLHFETGDFFSGSLPQADVLIMGHILHDWDLATKRMLLEKAYTALPDGGSLIVYETLIDDERRENPIGLLASLNMLIETPGGFDYTGADCRGWMKDAGFAHTRVEPLTANESMIVGVK